MGEESRDRVIWQDKHVLPCPRFNILSGIPNSPVRVTVRQPRRIDDFHKRRVPSNPEGFHLVPEYVSLVLTPLEFVKNLVVPNRRVVLKTELLRHKPPKGLDHVVSKSKVGDFRAIAFV